MKLSNFTEYEWRYIILFLGLDATSELCLDIGLNVEFKNIFSQKIKTKILQSDFTEFKYTDTGKEIIYELEISNKSMFDIFNNWVKNKLSFFSLNFDHKQWLCWRILIDNFLMENNYNSYFKNEKTGKYINGLFENYRQIITNFDLKLTEFDKALLTDHDLNLFSIYEIVSITNIVFVKPTFEQLQFRAFFVELVKSQSELDLDILHRVAITHFANDIKFCLDNEILNTPEKMITLA